MAFDDLRDLLEDQHLRLPIGGIEYAIAACSAEDWLWLNTQSARMDQLIRTGEDDAQVEGNDPEIFFRRCLGDTFDEMLTDNVTSKELQVAALTAFFWHLGNVSFAEAVWVNGGKALLGEVSLDELGRQVAQKTAPNRAARRTTSRSSTKPAPSKRVSATSRGASASQKAKTPQRSTRRTA